MQSAAHRLRRDRQLLRDLRVGEAVGHQAEKLHLALRGLRGLGESGNDLFVAVECLGVDIHTGAYRPRPARTTASTVDRVSQANVELVLRGYWAFVKGDLDAVAEMLDPDIEWVAVDPEEAAGH